MFINIEKSKDKKSNYEILLSNLDYYLVKDDDIITNLANLSAYLNYFLDDLNWVGFYLYNGSNLYLGPFQGLPACTMINIGNGVCGTSALNKESIVVQNVHEFPSHIGCDSASNSEIVVPIIKNDVLIGVLDVDSPLFSRFNDIDEIYLGKVIAKLVDIL